MDLAYKLRERGIKVTPQRRAVYKVLTQLCHCSVEQIITAMSEQHPNITVSTIYNVLDCFAEKELISRLSTPKGKLYYDITAKSHYHIITANGEIVDYIDPQLTALIASYLHTNPVPNYDIEKVTLEMHAK